MKVSSVVFLALASGANANVRGRNELWTDEQMRAAGMVPRKNFSDSHDKLLAAEKYPDDFNWCNKDGVNYCSMSRNQHIPQYCGSCWAHGALSALADRVKIARGAKGADINPSVQHLLNCGNAGSCHGGSPGAAYQWIKESGGISTETSQPYLACSSESKEGFCPHVDTSCKAENTARTCGSPSAEAGSCSGLDHYPNITISDYGSISGTDAMLKEIFNRGPIACGIAADPILNYNGGIVGGGGMVDHAISVVGWGTDAKEGRYWIVRNSWGEYWGEMGFIRVKFGALGLGDCDWATVEDYTAPEKQNFYTCHEGGDNCNADKVCNTYVQHAHKGCKGDAYKKISARNTDTCCAACSADPNCKQWSYNCMPFCHCFLSSKTVAPGFNPFATCGLKSGNLSSPVVV